jgi:putative MATE family efflux protein
MQIEQAPNGAAARQDMLANLPVRKLLWKLSLPAMAGMVTMSLYNVVDTIFIGRGVGSLAIAGVTIAFPIMMVMMALGMMVGIGSASVVSRSLGAGKTASAQRALGNAVGLSLGLGLVIMAVGVPSSEALLRLFGTSPAVMPYAKEYMDVILWGAAFSLYPMAINNLARAEGNARVAMHNMMLGAILNVILDPIFIFALHMGVRGAAIATVISQLVTSVYVTRYFLAGKSTVRLTLDSIRPDWRVASEILAVGFPSFVRMGAASIIVLIINRTLGLYGGDISIAAFGIVNRAMMFVAMPLIAIGQGLQPILGFSYGSGRFDRAYDVTKYALVTASLCSVGAFLILILLPQPIMTVFTGDAALIAEGAHAGRLSFIAFFLVGFQIVGSTVFQALGKVVKTLVTSTARQIVFFIPLVLVLPRYFQTDGVWLAQPAADVLSFIVVLVMLVPQLREFKRRSVRPYPYHEVLDRADVP